MTAPVSMSVEQMREAAGEGALLEFTYNSLVGAKKQFTAGQYADAIRRVGVEHCILTSDLGQADNPLPAAGFLAFLTAMEQQGFSAAELKRMAAENPARLLGLH